MAHHLQRMQSYPFRERGGGNDASEGGRHPPDRVVVVKRMFLLVQDPMKEVDHRVVDPPLSPCETRRMLDIPDGPTMIDDRDGKDDEEGNIQAAVAYHRGHKEVVLPKKDRHEEDGIAYPSDVYHLHDRILLRDQVAAACHTYYADQNVHHENEDERTMAAAAAASDRTFHLLRFSQELLILPQLWKKIVEVTVSLGQNLDLVVLLLLLVVAVNRYFAYRLEVELDIR